MPPVVSGYVGGFDRGPRWRRERPTVIELDLAVAEDRRVVRDADPWPVPRDRVARRNEPGVEQVADGDSAAVDLELGQVEILDYVISEDCGTIVNPMIVDGQIIGGALQGVGTALCEESRFDSDGQPLSSTFADYTMPGSTHLPRLQLDHLVTPSPLTEFGVKGLGEGGAIPPPAAIANAVNDALRGFGVEMRETPITPRRVLETLSAAQRT